MLLACLVTACQSDEPRADGDLETSFGTFAESFYAELGRRPLSDSIAIEMGLFGDLNVMAGERVVMGRYRYRVDSVGGAPTGHLSFLVRAPDGVQPVPVVVRFERDEGAWQLTEAEYVPVANEEVRTFRVESALDRGLEAWTRSAVRGAAVH